MSKITADRLTDAYIKIRDKRSTILQEYERQDNELKEQLEIISNQLLDICRETGVESLRTSAGTVSRTVKSRYWTNDWGNMYEFIMQNNAPQLLEQRIHQTNMKAFLAENPDVLPAGLNQDSKYTITVRRAR
jgi:hypothetical protein